MTDSDTLYELPAYLHQRSQNHFSHSVRVIETAAEDIPQRPLSSLVSFRTNPLYSDDDDDVVDGGAGDGSSSSNEGDGRGEHHEGIPSGGGGGGGRRPSKGLIVVGSNSSASSGYASNATSSAINSSRGKGMSNPLSHYGKILCCSG